MKDITTYEEQVSLLKQRGLVVEDEQRLIHYLKHIGYYRLSGYFKCFQNEDDMFIDGITFEVILQTYIFDRKLRLLLLDALERIEISFKAQVCDQMCFKTSNNIWYQDKSNFAKDRDGTAFTFVSDKIESALDSSKEAWVQKAKENDVNLKMFPSWMVVNVLTFGNVSFLFSKLQNKYQKKIACQYDLNGIILRSWSQSLTTVRNLCAHHNRLWNRCIDTPFLIPKQLNEFQLQEDTLFTVVIITAVLMEKISPRTHWPVALKSLMVEYSQVSRDKMGFPDNWEDVFDKAIKSI